MNNKSYTPIFERMVNGWRDFVNKYDFGALPAFSIFFIVVTLGMALNYLAMRSAIGEGPALLVSGLFEFGILGWKWTSGRKRNNDQQNEYVKIATWISVVMAVIMLVINLFRTTIEESLRAEPVAGVMFNGWQIAAYVTIGIAALVHIVFYLLFDQADTDKEYARKNKRSQNEIEQRSRVADDVIANTQADLKIIQKITVELNKLRVTYASLPHAQLESVLEKARLELLAQYNANTLVDAATSALPDIDGSGEVGDELVPVQLEEELEPILQDEPQLYHPVSLRPTVNGNGKKPPFS